MGFLDKDFFFTGIGNYPFNIPLIYISNKHQEININI
jgi:hypothetical protein